MNPEKIVEQKVYGTCFELKISIEIYDSKGTYSEKKKSYTSNQGMNNGTPDMIGCDQLGRFVAIELKAPGKENVCSLDQYNFLKRKIESNGFAVVVSCEKKLKEYYETWSNLNPSEGREYLLSLLPKKVLFNKKIIHLRL